MPQTPEETPADNDARIAAGLMFRYSRSCGCGRALPGFNELPGPTRCDHCLAAAPGENAPPADPVSPA